MRCANGCPRRCPCARLRVLGQRRGAALQELHATDGGGGCSYLFHQKEMLEDRTRMQAYYDAVFQNKACFEGKVRQGGGTGGATPAALGSRL